MPKKFSGGSGGDAGIYHEVSPEASAEAPHGVYFDGIRPAHGAEPGEARR